MKNAIIALIGIAMVIMVTVGINTVENKTMWQNELDSNLDKALERTMEILTIDPVYQISKNDTEVAADFIENFLVNTTSDATFKIDIITVDPEKGLLDVQVSESYSKNDTEVAADFIENFLVNTTSDATFKIDIITVDPEKGLLDVQVSESYAQVIGTGKVSARKTVILDDWENPDNTYFTIRFCLDDKIIKQVNIHGGDKITKGILPQSIAESETAVFKGWRMMMPQESDVLYTEDSILNLTVTSDLVFQAIYQEKN